MNLLVGHAIRGVDKHYIAKLRLGVLRAAAQRIADEIDNPQDIEADEDGAALVQTQASDVTPIEAYLNAGDASLKTHRHAHYLKRDDLYKLVWTAPVVEVAGQLGVSDVGLAKACRRAGIPLPARGYWARIEAGHHVGHASLPPAPPGLPDLIRITGTRPPPTSTRKAA